MASSDDDQSPSLQGETSEPEMSMTAQDGEANHVNQIRNQPTFHRYMHLPFELRSMIRQAAIQAADPDSKARRSSPDQDEQPCSRLASVSKEWQDDIERALFGLVRIDPLDEEDVATFKRHFTNKRRKFLTRLEIGLDDLEGTSPWHEKMGLLEISQIMEKVGQFFQYINGWDFSRDGERQQSLEIFFTTSHWIPGAHPAKDEQPCLGTSSLWDDTKLDVLTRRGRIPTNMALWAVKSEFPSSLNMVTHLTFSLDCVPLPATRRMIQAMPNLQTCVFEVSFRKNGEAGWRDLTDLIRELRASLPLLRNLTLHSQNYASSTPADVPPSMAMFAAVLRDFSQRLEYLRVTDSLDVHHAFFLPSLKELESTLPLSKGQWPKLQHLTIGGLFESSSSDQPKITAVDILVAAGRAATAMPALQTATLQLFPTHYFFAKREPFKGGSGSFKDEALWIAGFEESEEQRILTAWAQFIGGEAWVAKERRFSGIPPCRIYEAVRKYGGRSSY